MKTNLTSLLLLLLAFANGTLCQTQINNSGFESWVNRNYGGLSIKDPANWYTFNEYQLYGIDATTLQTTDSHSGNYAALLKGASTPNGELLPGILALKNLFHANGEFDMNLNFIPFTARPSHTSFWYKSMPVQDDFCAMFCVLSKWNHQKNKRDTVGYASWFTSEWVENYTIAELEIFYLSLENPDSVSIMFSSSMNSAFPTAGSEFYLDDFQFSYSTGFMEEEMQTAIQLFPNPSRNQVKIISPKWIDQVIIKNELGQTLSKETIKGKEAIISTDELPEGVYFFEVWGEETNSMKTIKVLKIN